MNRQKMADDQLTLVEHLTEFRRRLIICIVSIFAGVILSYLVINRILDLLIKPVGNLVFIAPQEAFITYIKLAVFSGIFLALPVILYQIWRFVASGLKKDERKYILIYGPFSFIFFLTGVAFAYFLILPLGIKFLLGFATDTLSPMISLASYVTFAGTMLLAFGVVFELPLVIMFLTKINIVSTKFLREKRKIVIILIFVLSAVLTPPDIVTQLLMAGPLFMLYEIGILLSRMAK